MLLTYNESDYLDEYGMKQYGEWYPIKLKLTGNYAMLIKERIYGKDQKLEELVELEWLKEKVFETIEKIYEKY